MTDTFGFDVNNPLSEAVFDIIGIEIEDFPGAMAKADVVEGGQISYDVPDPYKVKFYVTVHNSGEDSGTAMAHLGTDEGSEVIAGGANGVIILSQGLSGHDLPNGVVTGFSVSVD